MISPQALLAKAPIEARQQLSRKDTILYALGLGANELEFVYEERLVALPTISAVLAGPGFFWMKPELEVDWKRLVHGEQSVRIHKPIPPEGTFVSRTTFEAVDDKGQDKGALVFVSRTIEDEHGVVYAEERRTAFLRGDGGCGSVGGASLGLQAAPSDRACDVMVRLTTSEDQALLYRLSGDLNPLHIDPAVSEAAGLGAPILHGLCTFGIAARAVLKALCGNAPERLRGLDARFSAPVYPGETLETRIWNADRGAAAFETFVVERNLRVLSHGRALFV